MCIDIPRVHVQTTCPSAHPICIPHAHIAYQHDDDLQTTCVHAHTMCVYQPHLQKICATAQHICRHPYLLSRITRWDNFRDSNCLISSWMLIYACVPDGTDVLTFYLPGFQTIPQCSKTTYVYPVFWICQTSSPYPSFRMPKTPNPYPLLFDPPTTKSSPFLTEAPNHKLISCLPDPPNHRSISIIQTPQTTNPYH